MSIDDAWDEYDYACAMQNVDTPRWSVISTIRQQNVAEHEYGSLLILRRLAHMHPQAEKDPNFVAQAVLASLGHDREEAITGDMPSPGKPAKSPKKDQHSQSYVLAKCADLMEAYFFLRRDQLLGNQRVEAAKKYLVRRLDEWLGLLDLPLPPAWEFVESQFRYFHPADGARFPLQVEDWA